MANQTKKTWTGTGINDNFNQADHWDGSALPAAGDNIIIDGTSRTCLVTANDANVYGTLTVNSGNTLSIQTYNLSCESTTFTGNWTMGISAGTGLTCTGITTASTCVMTLVQGSIVNCSGNLSINSTTTINSTQYVGTLTISGSGNFTSGHTWYNFTQNASVTTTLTGSSSFTDSNSNSTTINGIVACGTRTLTLGARIGAGTITIGANADFTGTGTVQVACRNVTSASYVNNRATAFSLTGIYRVANHSYSPQIFPAWDFSNADINIQSGVITASIFFITAGTLKGKSLTINQAGVGVMTLECFTNNPSINLSGNVTLTTANGIVCWSKGNGTFTLSGSSGSNTIDLTTNLTYYVFNLSGAVSVAPTAGATYTHNGSTYTVYLASTGAIAATKTSGTNDPTTTGTLTKTRGTGDSSINFSSMAIPTPIHTLNLNCSGATKSLTTNCSLNSISGTGGTLNSSVSGTKRTVSLVTAGTVSGCTFKDINAGTLIAPKINAKSSCVNQGNNTGIVFKDVVKLSVF